MQQEVTGASKYSQKASEAPADVTVISAADVRRYGWKNLSDVLRSVRSFYLTNDRTYQYVGIRGVSPPGDLNNRILFTIDGVRVNDSFFDSVMMGETFPLDLDLIDRIEIIRGPGSSLYGGNAMFGVINLITRSGRDFDGTETGIGAASRNTYDGRVSAGRAEGNREWLISATKAHSGGGSYEFADIAPGAMTSNKTDAESWKRVFGKISVNDWQASLIYGFRQKYVPTGSYGTIFNDPNHHEDDTYLLSDVSKLHRINTEQELYFRAFTGLYKYQALWPNDNSNLDGRSYVMGDESIMSQWQGLETHLTSPLGPNQRWITGLEYTHSKNSYGYTENPPLSIYSYTPATGIINQFGAYAQDEIKLNENSQLTLGLRNGHSTNFGGNWSPRLAFVFQPYPTDTYKILYGTAFRNPDFFEHFNAPAGYQLKPEKIKSLEGILQHRLNSEMTLTVNVFKNEIHNVIQQDSAYYSFNATPIVTQGTELEWETRLHSDAQFRLSYSYQTTHQDSIHPDNSPMSMLKANLSLSPAPNWTSGLEAQGISSRQAGSGSITLGGYAVANLSIAYHAPDNRWRMTGSIYNLFDHPYTDPIQFDPNIQTYYGVSRSSLAQDGRLYKLKFENHF